MAASTPASTTKVKIASTCITDLDIKVVDSRICATHKETSSEWECAIENVAREVSENPLEYQYCTPENVGQLIATAIAESNWTCDERDSNGEYIVISFILEPDIATDLTETDRRVSDMITVVLRRAESAMCVARLNAIVQEQRVEIARLAREVAASGELARHIRITQLIAQAVAQFGPIEPEYFALAQRVFSAEADGAPIVFRALSCDQPIWLRSIIRYVNASEPFTKCVTDRTGARDISTSDPMHGLVMSKPIGGNTMSSKPMGLSDWIHRRGPVCHAQVLIIMELAYVWMGARCGIARIPTYTNPLGTVRRRITRGTTCKSPMVIFGYYGPSQRAARGGAGSKSEPRDEAARCCSALHQWLAPCKSVRLAHFTWRSHVDDDADERTDRKTTEIMRPEEITPEVARAFALAIPATPENGVPTDDRFIYNNGDVLSCTWDIPQFINHLSEDCASYGE